MSDAPANTPPKGGVNPDNSDAAFRPQAGVKASQPHVHQSQQHPPPPQPPTVAPGPGAAPTAHPSQLQQMHHQHHQHHNQHHNQHPLQLLQQEQQQPPRQPSPTRPSHPMAPVTATPVPTPAAQNASPPSRMDLKSWWRTFQKKAHNHDQSQNPNQDTPHRGIFGVPLRESIAYANVAISLVDEQGDSYIYGYVPIVVAKCGVFLKEKATAVEGIFRLSGSEKRIKELKTIFDSPDRYGKGLVWDGYTVHDAANVFRRYLNDLPEPVVPLDLYERFRDPLKGAIKKTVADGDGPQFVDDFDLDVTIQKYQRLIMEVPALNRQLLLYILDLLAVFAAKSDENRMNSQNLAAVFSPGIISHPMHAMAPEEYRLNQYVLIFLIENQDHFLIGMQDPPAQSETALSTTETQRSNAETNNNNHNTIITVNSEASVAAVATVPENCTLATPASQGPDGTDSVQRERDAAAEAARSNPTLLPGSESKQPSPAPAPSVSIATTSSRTGLNDCIVAEGPIRSSSPNGLARSKSVPSPGRNKLKKPRPISGNPSAQSSRTSLSAPKA